MADDERTDGVVDETEDLFRFDEFIAAKQEGGEEIDLEELLEALGELPDDAPPGGGGSDAAEGTGDPAGEPPAPQRGRAPAPGRAAAAAAPGAPALAEEPSGEPAAPRAGVPWLVVGAAVLLNAAVLGYALWSGRAVKEYVAELGAHDPCALNIAGSEFSLWRLCSERRSSTRSRPPCARLSARANARSPLTAWRSALRSTAGPGNWALLW